MSTLGWEGLLNARDLGGLPTDTGETRHGAVVRSDHPSRLTDTGWKSAHEFGLASIVSLRTAGLPEADAASVNAAVDSPAGISHIAVDIEDFADPDFVRKYLDTGLIGTPLYYRDALVRWPQRHAQALDAIAGAPGPVMFHCAQGFDRTGIIAILLLDNAGVTREAIVADYVQSFANVRTHNSAEADARERMLAARHTTPELVIEEVLDHVDADFWSTGAVSDATRHELRTRLTPL